MSFERSKRRRQQNRSLTAALAREAEQAEVRVLLAAAIDGTGNNLANPEWGSTNEQFLRLADAEYADGVSSVGGVDRPSARLISNEIADTGSSTTVNNRMMSGMVYLWGQFIDHDMTLTASSSSEKMSIAVPKGDPSFDPNSTGTKTINTFRSAYNSSTGLNAADPREQVNQLSAFLDGSMVYGSTTETAAALRTFEGGKLKTSNGNLLPMENGMFLTGDVRANENIELTAMQTLFVREHNYQATKIAAANPSLTDEQIYQKARSIVIAEIQAITYNEWLPALLGGNRLSAYKGYDATVNPGISNEFSTAAFRFGHSLLADDIEFLSNDGLATREGVSLSDAFFNPSLVSQNGIDPLLKYLSSDLSAELDTKVEESVRNFLFGPPGAGGLDLAALNIQRGRDHGLADYNTVRKAIGLTPVTSFSQITSNKALQDELKSLYGSVDNIDLWVGGLAEDHMKGSSLGTTFTAILVDQFQRLRNGDRYWYQNQFSGKALADIQRTKLSEIIERNTALTTIQDNAFFFKAGVSGTIRSDLNRDGKPTIKEPPVSGATVQLINTEDQSIAASTKSDRTGQYKFDTLDGLSTGVYRVQVLGLEGAVVATSGNIAVTGGDDFEKLDLAIPVPTPPRPTPPPKPVRGGSPANTPRNIAAMSAPATNLTSSRGQQTTISGTITASNYAPPTQASSTAASQSAKASTAATRGSTPTSAVGSSMNQLKANPATLALIDELFAAFPKEAL